MEALKEIIELKRKSKVEFLTVNGFWRISKYHKNNLIKNSKLIRESYNFNYYLNGDVIYRVYTFRKQAQTIADNHKFRGGCGKVLWNYSNQRENGSLMEDIRCGDWIYDDNIQELCEDCQKEKETCDKIQALNNEIQSQQDETSIPRLDVSFSPADTTQQINKEIQDGSTK